MGKLLRIIRFFYRGRKKAGKIGDTNDAAKQQIVKPCNPHIAYIRYLLEQVLIQRHMTYQTMRLAVEDIRIHNLEELEARYAPVVSDDIMDTLYQLSSGLNNLLIITDRPEYFADYVEMMYEEYGLVVDLQPRSRSFFTGANVVLDFSYEGRSLSAQDREDCLYIPIYRKPWKTAGNLDIMVPISYNIVIVERSVKEAKKEPQDKFEREFYA